MTLPAELRDLALEATGLSFTLADASAAGRPLVWVNPAFTATTGWALDEVVGRNCRFLQGAGTDPVAAREIGVALDRGEPVTTTLLNYTKDGRPFWNRLSISPIHDTGGVLTHFVGVQSDVSEAVAAQTRLRLLADITEQLTGTMDVDEVLERLISLVLPDLADWMLIMRVDDRGELTQTLSAHRDPAAAPRLAEMARALPESLRSGPIEDMLLAGLPVRRLNDLHTTQSREERLEFHRTTTLLDISAELGAQSALLAPLPCRRSRNDLMIIVRDSSRPQFSDEDMRIAADLGQRAGLILDNARLFGTQQQIAETLQRSLLPELPHVEGIDVAARYQAGQSGAEVGGDFYELLVLPDGAVGLVVGDVLGHDVLAAAAMGHLKGLIRACAYDDATSASPATVLERVDQLVAGLGMPTIATAVYAHLRPIDGGWRMAVSSAGHPPLVVRHPDGSAHLVSCDADVLLGVDPTSRGQASHTVPAGATIVGYTDGLVERRDEPIDIGLARLVEAVAAGPPDVEALCDHLVATRGSDTEDDIAVIAVRLGHA